MKKKILLVLGVIAVCSVFIFPIEAQSQKRISNDELRIYCTEIGEKYHICPELLMAICEKESSLNPLAVNGSHKGIMQVSEKWHSERMERLGVDDLFDAYGCILVATDYLSELFETYEDVAVVLGLYHGERKAIVNADNGTFSSYVKGILERTMELEEERNGY